MSEIYQVMGAQPVCREHGCQCETVVDAAAQQEQRAERAEARVRDLSAEVEAAKQEAVRVEYGRAEIIAGLVERKRELEGVLGALVEAGETYAGCTQAEEEKAWDRFDEALSQARAALPQPSQEEAEGE